MPSSQFILAYHSRKPLDRDAVEARLDVCEEYVESLHRHPRVVREAALGQYTGVIAWKPVNDSIGWPQFLGDDSEAAAWVGIPEHDAMTAGRPDALELARDAVRPGFDPDDLGAPYACLYRRGESLIVMNDSLGEARLYEFEFGDITVWGTRPGLGHIFAGVQVARNEAAWSGMATLGWNVGGQTHIGSGRQMRGSTRIVADRDNAPVREDRYASWISRSCDLGDSWEAASVGMVRRMSVGLYFKDPPIADLSGGKDSRLLAAAALTSGVTQTVRTVRSDHGEVETAERLVALYEGPITHRINEASSPGEGIFHEDIVRHVAETLRGSEGYGSGPAILRGPTFAGYVPLVVARINGHGGEALHGGEYLAGAWRDTLHGGNISGALDRLRAMVNVAGGVSEAGRERTMESIRGRLEVGEQAGVETAYGLLNYFYSSERMPLWAGSGPNRSVITPYYSSGLLRHIARTFVQDTEFVEFHRKILASFIPAWAEVPFYRPTGIKRRVAKFFWESFRWPDLKAFVLERADSSDNFEPDVIRSLVDRVEAREWDKRVEVTLGRFVWETAIDYVVDDINRRVESGPMLG